MVKIFLNQSINVHKFQDFSIQEKGGGNLDGFFAFSLKRHYFMCRELLHAVCVLQKLLSANINYNIGGGAAGWQAFADYWPAKGCPKE